MTGACGATSSMLIKSLLLLWILCWHVILNELLLLWREPILRLLLLIDHSSIWRWSLEYYACLAIDHASSLQVLCNIAILSALCSTMSRLSTLRLQTRLRTVVQGSTIMLVSRSKGAPSTQRGLGNRLAVVMMERWTWTPLDERRRVLETWRIWRLST